MGTLILPLLCIAYLPLIWLSLSRGSFFLEHLENFTSAQKQILYVALLSLILPYLLLVTRDSAFIQAVRLRVKLCVLLTLLTLLVITPPLLSLDSSLYLINGRNWIEFAANPLVVIQGSIHSNPWSNEVGNLRWLGESTFYGPLFYPLLIPIIKLNLSLIASILAYKCLNVLVFVFTLILFGMLIKERRDAKSLWLILAFNPALLVNFVLEAHNDLLLIFFLMAMLVAMRHAFWRSAGAFLGISIAIKYVTIILLPIFIFRRAAWIFIPLPLLLGLMLFDFPLQHIVNQLVKIGSFGCFYSCTPPLSLLNLIFSVDIGPLVAKVIFLCLFALLSWHFSRHQPVTFIALALSCLVFFAAQWVPPWYVALPIPFLLLASSEKIGANDWYLKASFVLTCYSLFNYFSA